MVRFCAAGLVSDWVMHCEQRFSARLDTQPTHVGGSVTGDLYALACHGDFLSHCRLSHMTTMNRPAVIERILGGNIVMAYRDTLGISETA